jgi:hypothetical protein
MNVTNAAISKKGFFGLRPVLLLWCAVGLIVFFLPNVIRGKYLLQCTILLIASMSVISGWLLLFTRGKPNNLWREIVVLITSVFLTSSIPVFLFELSQIRWLMRHPLHQVFSTYAWMWVKSPYNGYSLVLLNVFGSLLGRGY